MDARETRTVLEIGRDECKVRKNCYHMNVVIKTANSTMISLGVQIRHQFVDGLKLHYSTRMNRTCPFWSCRLRVNATFVCYPADSPIMVIAKKGMGMETRIFKK